MEITDSMTGPEKKDCVFISSSPISSVLRVVHCSGLTLIPRVNRTGVYVCVCVCVCVCAFRLLVGSPFESTGKQQTGDVFRCPLDTRNSANCSRLHLGEQHGRHVTSSSFSAKTLHIFVFKLRLDCKCVPVTCF